MAITPEGRPLSDKAMLPSNPPEMAAVIVVVPVLPCAIETELGLAVNVKLGLPPPVETVSETVFVSVTPPPVPVTVML